MESKQIKRGNQTKPIGQDIHPWFSNSRGEYESTLYCVRKNRR